MILSDESKMPFMVLSDAWYTRFKWLVVIVLPAAGTLYFALEQLWGLPSPEQVLGTVLAFQTFLGAILGVSTNQYKNSEARYDGTLTTTDTDKKKIVSVETNMHPDQLAEKDEVILKVKPASQ